jgi:hypothetical protein
VPEYGAAASFNVHADACAASRNDAVANDTIAVLRSKNRLFIDRLLVDPGGRLRREPDRKQSSLLSIQQQASAPPAPADRRDCIMRLQRNRRPSGGARFTCNFVFSNVYFGQPRLSRRN